MNTSSRLLLLWLDLEMLLHIDTKSCVVARTAQREDSILAEEAAKKENGFGHYRVVYKIKRIIDTW